MPRIGSKSDRLKPRLQRDWDRLQWGTSMVELIVALAVLATAVVGVGQFASTCSRGLRERELSSRIGWELTNAREQIGTWPLRDITPERIEGVSFSNGLVDELRDLHWQAEVVPITEPAQAIQVTLTLRCTYRGQSARPASLVFWIPNQPTKQPQSQEVRQ